MSENARPAGWRLLLIALCLCGIVCSSNAGYRVDRSSGAIQVPLGRADTTSARATPMGLAWSAAHLWVADPNSGAKGAASIQQYTLPRGAVTRDKWVGKMRVGGRVVRMRSADSVAVSKLGVWMSDAIAGKIYRFSHGMTACPAPELICDAHSVSRCAVSDIAPAEDGGIYGLVTAEGGILRVWADGKLKYWTAPQLIGSQGFDIRPASETGDDGAVVIADTEHNQLVQVPLLRNGAPLLSSVTIIASGMAYPTDVAVDGYGSVWATEPYLGRLVRFAPRSSRRNRQFDLHRLLGTEIEPWRVAVLTVGDGCRIAVADPHYKQVFVYDQ